MIASRQIAFGKGAKGLSAKDYIQDGLVAMWDGIENAGWGVHDANATVWTELITNTKSAKFDTAFKWEKDCLNTKGGTKSSNSLAPVNIMTDRAPGTAYTIEVIVKDYVSTGATRNLFSVSNSTAISLSTYLRNNIEQINAYFNNGSYFYYGTNSSSALEGSHTFTMVCDGKTPKVYIDGVYVAPKAGGLIGALAPNANSLVYFAWNNPSLHSEKYCRIACYKSALSAEEVAYHYRIDRARFNLP